jgi:hypothetical protein
MSFRTCAGTVLGEQVRNLVRHVSELCICIAVHLYKISPRAALLPSRLDRNDMVF